MTNKWTLFGNQSQEKDFIVTGGMLWWKHFLVIGCFNISANRFEIYLLTFIVIIIISIIENKSKCIQGKYLKG